MADKQTAAFGVFPQMRPRRSVQDREAAKDIPVAAARGFVSGVLGAPGDIESLARLLLNIQGPENFTMPRSKDEALQMLGQIFGADRVSLDTALPTSEDIEKRLPLRQVSETPTGAAFTGAAQLAGNFYTGPGAPIRLATGIPSAVGKAGKDFVMAAGQPATRIFIGPKAKTWDQAKADAAARMEKAGVDPVEIWRQTGTFRGADGIQRQEISDQGARFLSDAERKERAELIESQVKGLKEQIKPTKQKDLFPKALTEAKKGARERIERASLQAKEYKAKPSEGVRSETIIEHPELYSAYPELAEMRVVTGGYGGPDTRASFSALPDLNALTQGVGDKRWMLEMDIYDRGLKADPRSSSLHEMQHAVQTLEGMSPGGNITMAFQDPRTMQIYNRRMAELKQPSTFEEFQRVNRVPEDRAQAAYEEYLKSHKVSITPAIERMVQEEAAKEYYQRLAGEAEARAVQARRDMGPGERAQEYPYASYDVLEEDLLTKPPREYAAGGALVKAAKAAKAAAKSNPGPAFGAYGYTDDLLKRERGSFAGNFGMDYGQAFAPSFEFAPLSRLKTTEKVDEARVRSLMNEMRESGNTLDNRIPPVIVDSSGNVLDGHHRIEAARRLGYEQVPVIEKFDRQVGPKFAGGGALVKAVKAAKAAAKKEAPAVVLPSAVTRVQQAVRESKGDYGAKRVQRAADEIKDLEKLYKEEALRQAFTGDNAQAVMTMNPADFEKFALELAVSNRTPIRPLMFHAPGEIDKYSLPTDEYIQYLQRIRGGFEDVPFLGINKEEYGLPLVPFISGHEGRHRSRALAASGQPTSLVRLVPRAELREPLPRRSQEEYIEALRDELALTDNLVIPEGDLSRYRSGEGPPPRPAIVLPDIYAEGGQVKGPLSCGCKD